MPDIILNFLILLKAFLFSKAALGKFVLFSGNVGSLFHNLVFHRKTGKIALWEVWKMVVAYPSLTTGDIYINLHSPRLGCPLSFIYSFDGSNELSLINDLILQRNSIPQIIASMTKSGPYSDEQLWSCWAPPPPRLPHRLLSPGLWLALLFSLISCQVIRDNIVRGKVWLLSLGCLWR